MTAVKYIFLISIKFYSEWGFYLKDSQGIFLGQLTEKLLGCAVTDFSKVELKDLAKITEYYFCRTHPPYC